MTHSFADHPQMTVEEFEELAREAPETVTLEFIQGKLEVKPVPGGDHGEIVMWLMRQCMQHRPELGLYGKQGLQVAKRRSGRARPDGALAPVGYFAGQGEWASAEGVRMAVEVTSHVRGTDRRDRREMRDGYAAAGIPVYLLIDRAEHDVVVYTEPEPERGRYARRSTHPYGATVKLPAPVSVTLDTERLKDFAREGVRAAAGRQSLR